MENVINFCATTGDAFRGWLTPYLPWVVEKLGVASSADTVGFYHAVADSTLDQAYKKRFSPDLTTVIGTSGRSYRVKALAECLTQIEVHPAILEQCCFESVNKGHWVISATGDSVVSLVFEGLDAPLVLTRHVVQSVGSSCSSAFHSFICARDKMETVVSYFQGIERQGETPTVRRCDKGGNQEVQPLDWNTLTLDPLIDEMVRQDFISFLTEGKRDWFKSKKLPYRRGYLFHGPPGNGKTTLIRGMLTHAMVPAYSMKQFATADAETQFEAMFETASQNENSIIILEDIDRLFSNRGDEKDSGRNGINFSTFLNCLDGVSNAEGIIVIATANAPRNLDVAILERPGRFDRVVGFPNPSSELRHEYFMRLNPEFSPDKLTLALSECPSMSFAQLKEVYILGYRVAELANRKTLIESDLTEAIGGMSKMMSVKPKPVGLR